jgi:hypothetical protein
MGQQLWVPGGVAILLFIRLVRRRNLLRAQSLATSALLHPRSRLERISFSCRRVSVALMITVQPELFSRSCSAGAVQPELPSRCSMGA